MKQTSTNQANNGQHKLTKQASKQRSNKSNKQAINQPICQRKTSKQANITKQNNQRSTAKPVKQANKTNTQANKPKLQYKQTIKQTNKQSNNTTKQAHD